MQVPRRFSSADSVDFSRSSSSGFSVRIACDEQPVHLKIQQCCKTHEDHFMTVTRATWPPRGISLSLFPTVCYWKMTENVSFTELTGVEEHGKDIWTNSFLSFGFIWWWLWMGWLAFIEWIWLETLACGNMGGLVRKSFSGIQCQGVHDCLSHVIIGQREI